MTDVTIEVREAWRGVAGKIETGVQDVEAGLADYLVQHGYAVYVSNVVENEAPDALGEVTIPPDYENMTRNELLDYAQGNGIDIGGATRKADILQAIRDA